LRATVQRVVGYLEPVILQVLELSGVSWFRNVSRSTSAKSVTGLFSVLMVVTVSTSITEKTKSEQVPLVVTEDNQRGLLEVVFVGRASYAS